MPGEAVQGSRTRAAFGQSGSSLHHLARLAAATRACEAPAAVRERLRVLVVDTLAVTAWGSRRTEIAALRDVAGQTSVPGAATVLGASLPRPASLACALNGSAVAADQLQDGHRLARGHPASHVVLPVFALAEELGSSTDALLSAVLAGYEVGARVGIAMGGTPAGVHDIGTWGCVAAASGVAHLLCPGDAEVMGRAIELAASAVLLTDAATVFSGHPGGHAYLGASVAHGLWLGQAAAAGLAAAPGSLERFFAARAAAHWSGLPRVEGANWPEYEVLRGYVKVHPACAHLHGVLDALEDAMADMAEHGAGSGDVARVKVRTYAAAAAFAAPARNELEARFSIPTSVALVLLHHGLDEAVLSDAEVRSSAVRELVHRVEVAVDERLDAGYPDGRPAEVEIALGDGTRIRRTSVRPRGDADGEQSHDALRAKAERLIRGAFGGGADGLLPVLAEWPDRHTPRGLGGAFRHAAQVQEGAAVDCHAP
jgi:2-methylcitrate dehydratase PrpD